MDERAGGIVNSRTRRIVALEARADRHDEEANKCRWDAARLIAEELDSGKTQRQVAEEIGKTQRHVGRMAAVWREHGEDLGPQPFNSLYQKAKRAKKVPSPSKRPTGTTQSDPAKTPGTKAPADSRDKAPPLSKPSADELAAEARLALNEINPARLSKLGWKYLDASQERLSAIYDAHQEAARGEPR